MTFEEYEQQFQSSSFEEWNQKVNAAMSETVESLKQQSEKVNQMHQKRNEYEALWKQEKKKCGIIAKIFKKKAAIEAEAKAREYSEKFELFRNAFLKEYECQEQMVKEAKELQDYVRLALAIHKG